MLGLPGLLRENPVLIKVAADDGAEKNDKIAKTIRIAAKVFAAVLAGGLAVAGALILTSVIVLPIASAASVALGVLACAVAGIALGILGYKMLFSENESEIKNTLNFINNNNSDGKIQNKDGEKDQPNPLPTPLKKKLLRGAGGKLSLQSNTKQNKQKINFFLKRLALSESQSPRFFPIPYVKQPMLTQGSFVGSKKVLNLHVDASGSTPKRRDLFSFNPRQSSGSALAEFFDGRHRVVKPSNGSFVGTGPNRTSFIVDFDGGCSLQVTIPTAMLISIMQTMQKQKNNFLETLSAKGFQNRSIVEIGSSANFSRELDESLDDFVMLDMPEVDKSLLQQAGSIAGFTQPQLLDALEAANLAYHATDDGELNSQKASDYLAKGYLIEVIAKDGLLCVLLKKDSEMIISFRGTKNLNNVITDINLLLKYDPEAGGHTHQGFFKAFNDLSGSIYASIEMHAKEKNLKTSDLMITVTGHSLGGALATVCANQLVQRVTPNLRVATVGSPRVFSFEGAKSYNHILGNRTIRIAAHREDPVTAIPCGSWGFAHVGQLLKVSTTGSFGSDAHRLSLYINSIKALQSGDYRPSTSSSWGSYISGPSGAIFGRILALVARISACVFG